MDELSFKLNSTTPQCSAKTILWTTPCLLIFLWPVSVFQRLLSTALLICRKQSMYSNFFFTKE